MNPAPRLIGLQEILREAARLLCSNFLLFAGIAFFPGLASLARSIASMHPDPASEPSSLLLVSSYGLSFLLWVAEVILQAFGTAAICFAAPRLMLGETVTVRSAYNAVNPRAIRLIWVVLMQALFCFWPLFLVIVLVLAQPLRSTFPGSLASLTAYGAIIVLGFLPSAALLTRYALAQSACVIEDLSAHASIERSIDLSRGSRWSICLVLLALVLPYALLAWLCGSGIEQLIAISPLLTSSHAAAHAIRQLPGFVLGLAWPPFLYIALTLLYLKLVEQKENVSLPGLLNGALAAKRPKPYCDDGPAPWGEDAEILTEVEESSVGIPWSLFGGRDTSPRSERETSVREMEQGWSAPSGGNDLPAEKAADPEPPAPAEPPEEGKNPESTEPPQADPGESQ
jgi:hypothetical protein